MGPVISEQASSVIGVQAEPSFYQMLLYLVLSGISWLQVFNQRPEIIKRNWMSSQGGFGIEFQIDEERGIPFMPRRPQRNGPEAGDEFNRGFNNPNLDISVKFKNKIRNNNYEFIVTIQPEREDDIPEAATDPKQKKNELSKQYKVKRNLYEFQELFNYLESKNPQDSHLRQFDYNQMFRTTNSQSDDNVCMLQDFVNCLVGGSDGITGEKTYLLDRRVQEFLMIDDPVILQKIVMMSLSTNLMTQPISKVYTKLNIVDGYQGQQEEEKTAAAVEVEPPLIATTYVEPALVIKLMEEGISQSKFKLFYKSYEWSIQRPQNQIDAYLEKIACEKVTTQVKIQRPSFGTLLYFDYFSSLESFAALDAFRQLSVSIGEINVLSANLQIDGYSGKEVICFEIRIQLNDKECITYFKNHKDIKYVVQANNSGVKWQKIKYLSKEKQISHVQNYLEQILLKNIDRNFVIEFLISGHKFEDQEPDIIPKKINCDKANPLQDFLQQNEYQNLVDSDMDLDDKPEQRLERTKSESSFEKQFDHIDLNEGSNPFLNPFEDSKAGDFNPYLQNQISSFDTSDQLESSKKTPLNQVIKNKIKNIGKKESQIVEKYDL